MDFLLEHNLDLNDELLKRLENGNMGGETRSISDRSKEGRQFVEDTSRTAKFPGFSEEEAQKRIDTFTEEEEQEINSAGAKEAKKEPVREKIRQRHMEQLRKESNQYLQEHGGDLSEAQQDKDEAFKENIIQTILRLRTIKDAVFGEGTVPEYDRLLLNMQNILLFTTKPFQLGKEKAIEYNEPNYMVLFALYSSVRADLEAILSQISVENTEVADYRKELASMQNDYASQSVRLSDEYKNAVATDDAATWGVIMQRSVGEKVIQSDQAHKVAGGAISSVSRIEGGQTADGQVQSGFFKKESSVSGERKLLFFNALKKENVSEEVLKKISDLFDSKAALIEYTDYYLLLKRVLSASSSMPREMREQFLMEETHLEKIKEMRDLWALLNSDQVIKAARKSYETYLISEVYPGVLGVRNFKTFQKMVKINITDAMLHYLGIKDGEQMDERNFASETMADLLGMNGLLVHNDKADLQVGGQRTKGFMMSGTGGKSMSDLISLITQTSSYITAFEILPEVTKELFNLQLLDNITGQIDRHTGNFHFLYRIDEMENGEEKLVLTKVIGLDNDLSFGTKFNMNERFNQATPVAVKQSISKEPGSEGKKHYDLVLPAVDQETYERIKFLSTDLIRLTLSNYLKPEYVDAAIARFVFIKLAIGGSEDMGYTKDGQLITGDRNQELREKDLSLLKQYYPDAYEDLLQNRETQRLKGADWDVNATNYQEMIAKLDDRSMIVDNGAGRKRATNYYTLTLFSFRDALMQNLEKNRRNAEK